MKRKKVLNYMVVFLLVTSGIVIGFTSEVGAQGEDGEIYATDENKVQTDNFPIGSELYFTIESDLIEETLEVQLRYEGSLMDSENVETDNNGNYISSDEDVFFDLTGMSEGEYNLTISDTDGDFNSYFVNIYEQDFTEGSTVMTTADDHETPKDTFFAGETIYYSGEIKDQHDNSPEEHPYHVDVFLIHDGEENYVKRKQADQEDGSFSGGFDVDQEGNFTLIIRDLQNVELANDTFTVLDIYLSVSIEPELDIYTQGQEIRLQVESDYPQNIDVAILNSLEEPYRLMDGALWEDQELVNEFWSTEYIIPEDEEDGTYYVVVNSTETGETLEVMEFEIQKYSLEVETDKDVYHPGEEVKAYYSVENLLDGSQANNINVEWMMEYETEDGEDEIRTGDGIEDEFGEFEFTLPEDADVHSEFDITVWANDTEEDFQDEWDEERYVGDLGLDLNVDSDEYFVGQTLYVEIQTEATYSPGVPPVSISNYAANVEVDVELLDDDGEEVDERTVVTDGGGHYMLTMDLSDRDPGDYFVLGNATLDGLEDEDEDDFELLEESERLSVMLERDKGENPYYPGEEGTVFYTVTHQGETVTEDANVQYRLYSNQRVLDKDFADEGEIDFTVPDDYSPSSEGYLFMDVEATLGTEAYGDATTHIPVSIGEILLNPSQWEYEAEDEIIFEYEFHGIEEEIDSLEYRILDPSDELIMSGTPSDGIFEVTIPEHPAESYEVELEAVTEGGTSIETSEDIYRLSGYDLNIEIVTDSDYTTGVYEPGDEIEIHYELVSRDGTPLPETVRVSYEIHGHPEVYKFSTNETEGTITLTIPELNDGDHILGVTVHEAENSEIIEVDSDPWWGNRRVIGNASLSGTIMSILIIIALIIASLAFYRTKSGKTSPIKTQEMPTEEEEEVGGGEEFFIEEGEQEDQWSGVEQKEETIDEPESDETQIDSEQEW